MSFINTFQEKLKIKANNIFLFSIFFIYILNLSNEKLIFLLNCEIMHDTYVFIRVNHQKIDLCSGNFKPFFWYPLKDDNLILLID